MVFRGGRGTTGRPHRGNVRGRGRGRGRGRPLGDRYHGLKQKTKDWTGGQQFGAYQPRIVDEPDLENEDELEDEFDLASAAPLAYDALLTLMKDDETKPNKKKRKIATNTEQPTDSNTDLAGDVDLDEDDTIETNEPELLDDDQDAADPFETHFNTMSSAHLDTLCTATDERKFHSITTANNVDGRLIIQRPDANLPEKHPRTFDVLNPDSWHLKSRLKESSAKLLSNLATSSVRSHLFLSTSICYADLMFLTTNHKDYPRLRSIYSLHALNHVFKTRDRILKNNAKLSAHPEADTEYRDQGFTRLKILILLPTRNTCLEVVNDLIALSGAEQVENRKRFNEQFGTDGVDPLKNANKPDDFKAIFAGNTDDAFRIGIKFTRKTIKLFSQFYGSDIIVASPLGLRMAIGDVGAKTRDWDYLSSIEMVIVDSASALAMQNWEHVEYCLEHINFLPKESHGCDYGRVRNWALEEKSKYLRQTILLSDYEFPELRALFANLKNIEGKTRTKLRYDGAIMNIGISVRQVYHKFESATPSEDPDRRFDYFGSSILPRLKKLAQAGDAGHGCLLFVPSYFDFVRVRNHLSSLELTFEAISEYSSTSELTRSRQLFASGRSPVLVMTERLHHYRRYEIKGVRNVLFYQLPEHAQYFTELVRCAAAPGQSKAEGEVRIAFSRWDEGRLERIVGSKRVGKMLTGKDTAFEFV